jgi:hypothetical protein
MKPRYLSILRDTLLLLPRLLGASARVVFAGIGNGPSKRLKQLASAEGSAQMLGLEPRTVRGARVEEVHSGTATRSRLCVEYTADAGPERGPGSFFIKSKPPGFASALFGVLFDLGGNEVLFYRNIRDSIPVKTPRVYFAEGDSSDYVLLLEDLGAKNCEFQTLASKCSFEEARSIVRTLGRMHGTFWQSERFDADLAWVRRFETDGDFRLLNLVRNLSVPIAIQKYAHVIPEEIREVIPHLMKNYQRLEEQWAQGPRTLLHGDAHLGNMYFQDGEAGLLDWQVCQYGQGMRDISYLLVNSLSEELRLAHQKDLIRDYLGVLDAQGVSLDFETAWRQYRLQSVYAWIAGVVTAPSNFQSEQVVAAGLGRACAAVLDLDAIALIREL